MLGRQHDRVMKSIPNPSPAPLVSLQAVLAWLARGHGLRYSGEPVTHWAHATQTAALAQRARASPALVAAALLHDIGHLAAPEDGPRTPSLHGIDDHHEQLAPRLLSRLFGPDVTEPIRLHVDAKRYLAGASAGYADGLSRDSQRSLLLQGGPMSASECAAFRQLPHAEDALRLRCWDDLAKDAAAPPLTVDAFLAALGDALRPS